MQLDEIKMCYKEYPPVALMQCDGHRGPMRLALWIPGVLVLIFVLLILIIKFI